MREQLAAMIAACMAAVGRVPGTGASSGRTVLQIRLLRRQRV